MTGAAGPGGDVLGWYAVDGTEHVWPGSSPLPVDRPHRYDRAMAEPAHRITLDGDGDAIRVVLAGELDITARDELRDIVVRAVADAGPGGVVIDFGELAFIESEAMSALIAGLNAARTERVPFRAVGPRGLVLRVLEISGVLELFDS